MLGSSGSGSIDEIIILRIFQRIMRSIEIFQVDLMGIFMYQDFVGLIHQDKFIESIRRFIFTGMQFARFLPVRPLDLRFTCIPRNVEGFKIVRKHKGSVLFSEKIDKNSES